MLQPRERTSRQIDKRADQLDAKAMATDADWAEQDAADAIDRRVDGLLPATGRPRRAGRAGLRRRTGQDRRHVNQLGGQVGIASRHPDSRRSRRSRWRRSPVSNGPASGAIWCARIEKRTCPTTLPGVLVRNRDRITEIADVLARYGVSRGWPTTLEPLPAPDVSATLVAHIVDRICTVLTSGQRLRGALEGDSAPPGSSLARC